MTTTTTMTAMPELPGPGQQVSWRHPDRARAWGWEAVFGPGPFVVARAVDHSADGMAAGLVLRTAVGKQEIHEVWLALADEAEGGGAVPVPSASGASALLQRR
jgi:hypothetical protein